eukprot:TRINITY_DN8527_c0_g3_i3.p1 TRINITY_DN8527_c0_g3~~TRINITY_DN8527_c0_g3_i3.p1  ORF type:complete len:206 (-),score=60.57 TRINITY_DN8527_c0_g3_i3:346-963(-)
MPLKEQRGGRRGSGAGRRTKDKDEQHMVPEKATSSKAGRRNSRNADKHEKKKKKRQHKKSKSERKEKKRRARNPTTSCEEDESSEEEKQQSEYSEEEQQTDYEGEEARLAATGIQGAAVSTTTGNFINLKPEYMMFVILGLQPNFNEFNLKQLGHLSVSISKQKHDTFKISPKASTRSRTASTKDPFFFSSPGFGAGCRCGRQVR